MKLCCYNSVIGQSFSHTYSHNTGFVWLLTQALSWDPTVSEHTAAGSIIDQSQAVSQSAALQQCTAQETLPTRGLVSMEQRISRTVRCTAQVTHSLSPVSHHSALHCTGDNTLIPCSTPTRRQIKQQHRLAARQHSTPAIANLNLNTKACTHACFIQVGQHLDSGARQVCCCWWPFQQPLNVTKSRVIK